jgi:alkanesulfonate monooxygenase SsuD/methylene tetrahydromethanopterin reductase-like flavin-dependent oxidoreductase (luciferase family)
MRVGIVLDSKAVGSDAAAGFDRLVARARLAEQEGYSSVWIGESHFSDDRPEPVPLIIGGALVAETDNIRLGFMVKLALEHPVKTAEDVAVLDVMSGGRVLFGTDPGATDDEIAGYGVPAAERRARFSEALDIIVNAWTSDAFAYLGEYHTLPGRTHAVGAGSPYVSEPYSPPYVAPWHRVDMPFDYLSVLPKPVQIPHPPVFVMTDDDDAAMLAASKGYSPVLGADLTADEVAARAIVFWRALEAAGRNQAEVCLTVVRDIRVTDDGDVDDVVHGLKQLQQEAGYGQLLCRFYLPDLAHEQGERSLKLFAAEVRPRLEM